MKVSQLNSFDNRKHALTTNVTINAPKGAVWEVLADFNNVYTWAPGVSASHGLGSKDQEVGAARHCKLNDFGAIDEVVTEWAEGEGFTFTISALGPLTNAISRWRLVAVNEHTTHLEVDFAYDIRFSVFGKLMHKLIMRKKLEASLPQALEALKQRVETGKVIRPIINAQTAVAQ